MPGTIGIGYNPTLNLFYSGLNQTALLLTELFSKLGYTVSLIDTKNTDAQWWENYPKLDGVRLESIYQASQLDYFVDIDGLVHSDNRKRIAKTTIVFLRTFLQFAELDGSVYPEEPYVPRSFENVAEIWCWDILNPQETLPSIQTLFPCPIKTVPFIWSPSIVNHLIKEKRPNHNKENDKWTVHIAEKNTTNSSSAVMPLVAIRELHLNKVINAEYHCHNMSRIIENKFLKENVLKNIEITTLPVKFEEKVPFYDWLSFENGIFFSHSRFTPLRIGLLNAVWMGLPLVHNSSWLKKLHPFLEKMYYFGNEVRGTRGICNAFTQFIENPEEFYGALSQIRNVILSKWSIEVNLEKWRKLLEHFMPHTTNTISDNVSELLIAFSDMWPGFNYQTNFFTDALRHERPDLSVKGVSYSNTIKPNLLIFGPYSNEWKSVPVSVPKVFFSGENWKELNDSSVKLYLTSLRKEDDTHIRIPTWMMFIDWFSDSKELPNGCEDNPIRIPVHFALTPHPVSFKDRKDFCGFVVSNPVCSFRNETFKIVNDYKRVDSGGALYNNIGGQLALKYPGGGCGDISKYHFFSSHQFSISFENSQAHGYITEKVLHAKIAGCVPIYWGDKNTDSDFMPNSFINLSNLQNPEKVVEVIKMLEANPDMCSRIASTPILNEEKKRSALKVISNMADKLLTLSGIATSSHTNLSKIKKTFVVNLDTRKDRWESLCKAEPKIMASAERVSAVNGKELQLNKQVHTLFKNNNFHWKKGVIGCALSHITIWEKIKNLSGSPNDLFLILEDDVRFVPDIVNEWTKYASMIPSDAELLYLGGVLPPNKTVLSSVLDNINESWAKIKPNNFFSVGSILPLFHFCTYSYVISKGAVEKILAFLNHNGCPMAIDHFLGQQSLQLHTYVANPLLAKCFQDDDPVYNTATFNNADSVVTYDSDISNNIECFSKAEMVRFEIKSTKPLTMYYWNESNIQFDLYERRWLEEIFGLSIEVKPIMVSGIDVASDDVEPWFIVQRPHSKWFNSYFQQLQVREKPFKVLHLSDEFCNDDITFYQLSMCKAVVRNYLRADVPDLPHILTIPLGYHYKADESIEDKTFSTRKLVWSFHGTNWFGRQESLTNLTEFVPNNCHLLPDWNHPNMTKESQYLSTLGNTKFCPALRGNNNETFRLYEALEAGVIPIYVTGEGNELYGNWLFSNLLVGFDSWEKAKKFIEYLLAKPETAETYRTRLIKKWIQWKDEIKVSIQKVL